MRRRLIPMAVCLVVAVLAGSLFGIPPSTATLAQDQAACAEPADEAEVACPVPAPESIPIRPGTILLQDSFEDPSYPIYGFAGRAPGIYDFAYVDGYLRARRLATSGTAVVLLPYDPNYDHATVAVNARLVGEVEGRYLLLGCRRQDSPVQTGYRFVIAPASGRFTLVRWDQDGEVVLAPWSESSLIRRDAEWNRLELTCAGSTIDAIVNGQVIASTEDETYPSGQVFLGVGIFPDQEPPAEAHLDDLEVTRR